MQSPAAKIVPQQGKLQGRFTPPGDKSISHRAVMFGCMATGESHFTHFLEAEDCLHTLQAFQSMGLQAHHVEGSGEVRIQGRGLEGLSAPAKELYLGNSGTSMRLLMGLLAGRKWETVLSGDPSLSARPMKRVTVPLKKMGAQIKGREDGNFAPITIRGGRLSGIEFDNVLSSAQVKSALIFAGLQAEGETRIREALPSRDHTERFLEACGVPLRREGETMIVSRSDSFRPLSAKIPGDFSAAAFFIVGAAIVSGAEILIDHVCLNPTRTGLLNVLRRMGAEIEIAETGKIPEPVGRIKVTGSRLRGTRVAPEEIPSLIDELPILMIAMALAEGESLIAGAAELRVKESDRIACMVSNLKAVGADAEELPDGCLIRGRESLKGGPIQSFYDHRTAMSFSIAALACERPIEIDDVSCVATSFPNFYEILDSLRCVNS